MSQLVEQVAVVSGKRGRVEVWFDRGPSASPVAAAVMVEVGCDAMAAVEESRESAAAAMRHWIERSRSVQACVSPLPRNW